MPCIPTPPIPLPPPIPGGITIAPPTPPPFPGVGLCCKLALPPTPIPPIPLGLVVPAAVVVAYNTVLKNVREYIDQLALTTCPKE